MGKYDAAPTLAAGLIRTARDRAGVTQQQLADNAGVTQQAISAYETGRQDPRLQTLIRLVAAAGFEMRIQLVALDDHDKALEQFIASLSPDQRTELEEARRARTQEARLRRVRGQ